METQPDTTNLVYLDEYHNLSEKVRLRRLAKRVGEAVCPTIIYLPDLTEAE